MKSKNYVLSKKRISIFALSGSALGGIVFGLWVGLLVVWAEWPLEEGNTFSSLLLYPVAGALGGVLIGTFLFLIPSIVVGLLIIIFKPKRRWWAVILWGVLGGGFSALWCLILPSEYDILINKSFCIGFFITVLGLWFGFKKVD